MDSYDRKFMRMKRFAPSLVDTEEKMAEKFVMGLDLEIRCMVKTIDLKTYEKALRTAKALEKHIDDDVCREKSVTVGRNGPMT